MIILLAGWLRLVAALRNLWFPRIKVMPKFGRRLLQRDLQNGGFQTWHGHLAREERAFFHKMPQEITGKMPVPRSFASPSCGDFAEKELDCARHVGLS
jgi:hypothetical protein